MYNCNADVSDTKSYQDKIETANETPIGMAYVPWQHFNNVYEPDKALVFGTIFPELNKPFCGKKGRGMYESQF
ncbi:MAG: spore coat associated protein CotJA [Lachnospiraceae bacterium]